MNHPSNARRDDAPQRELSDTDTPDSNELPFVSLVLQEAIRSTLGTPDAGPEGIQEELNELAGIRKKYPGPLNAGTELTEMVQVVLKRHLGKLFTDEKQLQTAAAQISRTLFDDLAVRRRLESFRDRLKATTE